MTLQLNGKSKIKGVRNDTVGGDNHYTAVSGDFGDP
jgi:hypothetical protein